MIEIYIMTFVVAAFIIASRKRHFYEVGKYDIMTAEALLTAQEIDLLIEDIKKYKPE